MTYTDLADINLALFDGGAPAGGEGTGAAAPAGQAEIKGGSQAAPGNTRRGRPGGTSVLYGKQPAEAGGGDSREQQPSDAGREKEPEVQTTSNTLEEKRRAYRALVEGEYKDFYTEDTQRIIDRRFRETRDLEQQAARVQPVLDMLMQRYKIPDGDLSKLTKAVENDDAYWSQAAEEAGMNVEQYKQFQKLQRENAALLQACLLYTSPSPRDCS